MLHHWYLVTEFMSPSSKGTKKERKHKERKREKKDKRAKKDKKRQDPKATLKESEPEVQPESLVTVVNPFKLQLEARGISHLSMGEILSPRSGGGSLTPRKTPRETNVIIEPSPSDNTVLSLEQKEDSLNDS